VFKKILIANRGEIALRVIRTCQEMGIRTVAIYSDADRTSLHVLRADEAYCAGEAPASESYLAIEKIIAIAKKAGCDAVHPGYGFLAENSEFCQACEDAGLIFIGPNPKAMQAMGDKVYARNSVHKVGVPIIPGLLSGVRDFETMHQKAEEIGYPVLIKAAMGGGGKGMRVVRAPNELKSSFELCFQEAESAFRDPTLYLEKYIEKPRHIEFQILADNYGTTLHLGERECSIQRRHQKLIEESPSVALDENLRQRMGVAAVSAARSVGYNNAGTIEFMLDTNKNFYFLEMNTRLQVEHPVTELVTGIDLVSAQIRIAAGEKLWLTQDSIRHSGHAIEGRIYAEDTDAGFLPSAGTIEFLREPSGPGIRVDASVYAGYGIPVYYDPLIGKLIVWAETREGALSRMRRGLAEFKIIGVKTTIDFLYQVMNDGRFKNGKFDTHFIEEMEKVASLPSAEQEKLAAIIGALFVYTTKSKSPELKPPLSPESQWKLMARREGLR
jgi:acetyl-CoA carboxylase biotin carboxylase subunit